MKQKLSQFRDFYRQSPFGGSLLLAASLHLLVILGVTFISPDASKPSPLKLDVTLVSQANHQRPDKAKLVSQTNHLAQVHRQKPQAEPPAPSTRAMRVAVKQAPQAAASVKATKKSPKPLKKVEISNMNLDDLLQEMRQKANRERRRTISASTYEARDALYLEGWQRKIERIGNLNYPSEAKQRGIYGDLRLLVAINQDGSLKSAEVLHSSGKPILDDAALRIVQLAAPYSPLPPEMRKDTDVLEIVRTWQFLKSNRFSR